MDAAKQITSTLKMRDVAEFYGFKVNKSGFMCCPFHKEKTASLKIYDGDRGFSCFGCNTNGSVIDFVMKLFEMDFQQAIRKIDYDFNLGLFKKLSIKEKHAILRQQEERERQKLFEELAEEYSKEQRQHIRNYRFMLIDLHSDNPSILAEIAWLDSLLENYLNKPITANFGQIIAHRKEVLGIADTETENT